MAHSAKDLADHPPHRRYTWPWFVLAAFVAGIILAILWLSVEIRHTQRIRDLNSPGIQGK
jgi:hypothetical protein